jgi:hypothetical protein
MDTSTGFHGCMDGIKSVLILCIGRLFKDTSLVLFCEISLLVVKCPLQNTTHGRLKFLFHIAKTALIDVIGIGFEY